MTDPSVSFPDPAGSRVGTRNALVEALGRNWRSATILAVAVLAAIGWGYLILAVAGGGRAIDAGFGMRALAPLIDAIAMRFPALAIGEHGALMPAPVAWGVWDVALVFAMWAAMVFAMMLPTAAPTFLAYSRAVRGGAVWVMAGYTAVWLGIAVLATAVQAGMTAAGALSPHMAPAGIALSASILVAAGIYQFTPLKAACLVRCRNPHAADTVDEGPFTALRIGVEEGLACLGCCWALMAVMFAAGLMNLVAMAFFGALMGWEKLASGFFLTRIIGVLLLVAGLALATGPFIG
ncbi:DUF2182 domain-containing protein [Chthonobacter albigriseus]|uniref:DUF2182 domain-containing protein n=1 Tax=Chthonobacter albigriseus TaxID=1683161 RepID=UPI0015EED3A5|nr:DUF2182 domain-containing protein [Chthonobacter albigriseus]